MTDVPEMADQPILVIEDNSDFRALARWTLSRLGYAVVEAENGREALKYLRSHPKPRLIILDLMMPIMDGRQFRAEQLKDEQLRDIPTLICTCEPDPAKAARELNAAGYISKARGLGGMLDAVSQVCQTA